MLPVTFIFKLICFQSTIIMGYNKDDSLTCWIEKNKLLKWHNKIQNSQNLKWGGYPKESWDSMNFLEILWFAVWSGFASKIKYAFKHRNVLTLQGPQLLNPL